MTFTLPTRTVYLLWGPNGGDHDVCGVYAELAEAEERAKRYNDAERAENFPAGGKEYFVEAWVVS